VVDLPKHRKPIPLKWVFKVKDDGTYKARLVAKGFRQKEGRDYLDVYASTAKAASFKIFCAISAQFGWPMHHIDFVAAFLNAELTEEIYIHLPEGFREKHPGQCGLLQKTLYGLKQSPREWYKVVYDALIALGFIRFDSDHSVFGLFNMNRRIYLLVHVDDVLCLSPKEEDIAWLKQQISKTFDITDNGVAKRFLGIDIIRHDGKVYLSQEAYIDKILRKFGLEDVNPVSSPFNEKEVLKPNEKTASPEEVTQYRKRIGSLIWLMVNTRPEVPFPVAKLARHGHNPSGKHFTAAKRVYRYFKGTKKMAIAYSYSPDALFGFVDADWAGKHAEDSLSTSGFVFKLANGPISWISKKQTCVSLSSTESEYVAASLAVQEVVWLHLFVKEMGLGHELLSLPTAIYEDNAGAICLTESQDTHQRTKHIDVKYHHIRSEVAKGVCKFVKIHTDEQAADGLTKPLGPIKFERFTKLLGLRKLPEPPS
jgi:hypothetical protein